MMLTEKPGQEVKALKSEVDRIAKSTQFNKINLLDGSIGAMKQQKIPD